MLTTTVSLALLAVCLVWLSPSWANLIAVGVGSGVSFELNRRWVWKRSSATTKVGQLLVFVATAFAFLAISMVAVREVDHILGSDTARGLRVTAIEATTVAVFGIRWVLQFFLLDCVFFRSSSLPVASAHLAEL